MSAPMRLMILRPTAFHDNHLIDRPTAEITWMIDTPDKVVAILEISLVTHASVGIAFSSTKFDPPIVHTAERSINAQAPLPRRP